MVGEKSIKFKTEEAEERDTWVHTINNAILNKDNITSTEHPIEVIFGSTNFLYSLGKFPNISIYNFFSAHRQKQIKTD
jgi:hypothetical protein